MGTVTGVLRAKWVLPIDRPPIEGAWIETAGDRITGLGQGPGPRRGQDLGRVAILPGLVNAHTHLELSWLAGRVPPAGSMVEWIRELVRQRFIGPDRAETAAAAIEHAAIGMRDTGTALVGDISNSLTSLPAFAVAGLGGVVFHELLGFNVVDPAAMVHEAWAAVDAVVPPPGVALTVAAHAPYSTSPPLVAEIARRRREAPLAIHLGESPEEIEFLRTGRGPFRELLEELRAWHPSWQPPDCDPVEYLSRLGYLQRGVLAVHAVHLSDQALARLADAGAVVVTCPRSNAWVGAGLPRVSHFYAAGLAVAIGTDSLASTSTLNLFDELAELRRIAPDVAASALLDSATRQGARALGAGADFGTISTGKRAALIAVTIPDAVSDVEEYLVSGVPATSVRRLS